MATKRRTADERALAVVRLAYRDGLSDEALRRTALYSDIRKAQNVERERRKRRKADLIEATTIREATPEEERELDAAEMERRHRDDAAGAQDRSVER